MCQSMMKAKLRTPGPAIGKETSMPVTLSMISPGAAWFTPPPRAARPGIPAAAR
jgi:hypothetical protein